MKKILNLLVCFVMLISVASGEVVSEVKMKNEKEYIYKNNLYNYEITVPIGLKVNEEFANLYTRFYNDKVTVDVLIDDFATKGSSYSAYITYGNKEIVTDKYHTVNYKRHIKFGKYNAYEMSYDRIKLAGFRYL